MHSKYAFSLVELMVAVGIVGILVTLALPRYHAFMVQARRGEAKSNLHQIAILQEAYRAEHGAYYYGAALRGTEGIGYKDKYGRDGDCVDYSDGRDEGLSNRLGFRPKNCDELRYFYQLQSAGVVDAFAYSDANRRHIYPDCDGAGPVECGYNQGDAVRLALNDATPVVCRNITKHCPPETPGVLPPPPTCSCSWATGLWGPAINLASKCSCENFTQTRSVTWNCTGTPPCPPTNISTKPTTSQTVTGTNTTSSSCIALCVGCTNGSTTTSPDVSLLCPDVLSTVTTTTTRTPNPPCTDLVSTQLNVPGTKGESKQAACAKLTSGYVSGSWSAPNCSCPGSTWGYSNSTCIGGCACGLSCTTPKTITSSCTCECPTNKATCTTDNNKIWDATNCCRTCPTGQQPNAAKDACEPITCDSTTQCCHDHDSNSTTPAVEIAWDNTKGCTQSEWKGTATNAQGNGCCTTTPSCNTGTHCCDGTTVKENPGLTCDEWKGTYATDTINYGCCSLVIPPGPVTPDNNCSDPNTGNVVTHTTCPTDSLKEWLAFPDCRCGDCRSDIVCDTTLNNWNSDDCECTPKQCTLLEEVAKLLCISPDIWHDWSSTEPSCECDDGKDPLCKEAAEDDARHYYSGYSDQQIVAGDSFRHSDYDTDLSESDNCLCDGARNYIPNRSRPHTDYTEGTEQRRLGGCVCRNNHKEVVGIIGKTECETCTGTGKDLRRGTVQNKHGNYETDCVTCGLAELLSDSGLALANYYNPHTVSNQVPIGKECSCAKYSGDGHVFAHYDAAQRDVVQKVVQLAMDTDKHEIFLSWRTGLGSWASSAPATCNSPPDIGVGGGNGGLTGEDQKSYFRSLLWTWYLNARKAGCNPPLPDAWKNFYSGYSATDAPSTLEASSELRYVTCTIATWANN